MNKMELMPEELIEEMPALYDTEGEADEDRYVLAHWFSCVGGLAGWDWYGLEYDKDEKTVYGFVHGYVDEFGYFSINEFESLNAVGFDVVERDLYWDPITVAELKQQYNIK